MGNKRLTAENESLIKNIQELRTKTIARFEEKVNLLTEENEKLKENKYDPQDYVYELFNLRHENKELRFQRNDLNKQLVSLTKQNTLYEEKIKFLKEALTTRAQLPNYLPENVQDLIVERDELSIQCQELKDKITDIETKSVVGKVI